jgi:trehalose-phosphatase
MTVGPAERVDEDVLGQLARTPRLLVATDFDGVLAPIVDDPERSAPLPASMDALAGLAVSEDTSVAIVSGRERRRLESLVPESGRFILVGSHGAELHDAETEPDQRHRLDSMIGALDELAREVPGLFVEVKTLSVAVHFRRVGGPERERGLAAVEELTARWPAKVVTGKEVVEFALATANKGDAILALAGRTRATATVYLGDDATDEDAFAVLGPGDVGVKVGPGETAASRRLGSPADVSRFLERLLALRRDG